MSEASTNIYDALAPHYREYSKRKAAYLAAVDRFILEGVPRGAASLLDVGAGDGVRGMALAQQLQIRSTVLCDNSAEMIARCRALGPSEVWQTAAENLPDTKLRFDVITCLWNVLGHIQSRPERIRALTKMGGLLTDRGRIFFDVNNRHNAAAYGWIKVFGRIVIDTFHPDEHRGDASFDWKIGDHVFPSMGHLFTPREIEGIVRESGLRVLERIAIDYANGNISRSPILGHMVYLVVRQRC